MKIKIKHYNYKNSKYQLGEIVRFKYKLSYLLKVQAMLKLTVPPIIEYVPDAKQNRVITSIIEDILHMNTQNYFSFTEKAKWIYILEDIDGDIVDYFEESLEPHEN